MVSLTGGVVNGWDNVKDNNNGKSFLGSLGLSVGDLGWTFNTIVGPEEDERGSSTTALFDTVLSYTPVENIDFLLNYDYGTADDVGHGGGDAVWTGVAGITTIGGGLLSPDIEDWSLALRGEWFADEDNFRFGDDNIAPGRGVDVWEITATLKWQMTDHLQARLEYRHDDASRSIFENKNGFKKKQDSMIVEFAYLM